MGKVKIAISRLERSRESEGPDDVSAIIGSVDAKHIYSLTSKYVPTLPT